MGYPCHSVSGVPRHIRASVVRVRKLFRSYLPTGICPTISKKQRCDNSDGIGVMELERNKLGFGREKLIAFNESYDFGQALLLSEPFLLKSEVS